MSDYKNAIKIFRLLLEKGQLDRETQADLFIEFRNPEVRALLNDIEEEMEFKILEASSTLYLVPDTGNGLLGFLTKDIREWVSGDARLADAFLLSYISMIILFMFFGGKNINPKQREFLRISSLVEELDRRFGAVLDNNEQNEIMEERYAVNFSRIAELWNSKQGFEEKGRKTKVGTIINACRLLEREALIRMLEDDKEIRTTKKLDDLMLNYYLNDARLNEINDLFSERQEPNA